MKALLITEIDQEAEILRRILKSAQPKVEVTRASNVEEVMAFASSDGPYGFFIIDCDMKEVDPNELGLNLIDLTGTRPIIFLGSTNTVNDRISQELFTSNENNQTIVKPVSSDSFSEELNGAIDAALTWARKEDFEQSLEEVQPGDYIGMKLKSFYLFSTFPYDIYLSITNTTYIKIIEANKPYSQSTLSTYARKNVKLLYIKKDEQIKYLESEATKCLKNLRNSANDIDQTFLLLLRSITILHQYILAIGVSPLMLTLANAASDKIIEVFDSKFQLGAILKDYPVFYEGISSKSLLTAFIAEGIARKIGWESITTKKKLAISAILQDISLPEETMSKITSLKSPILKNYNQEKVQLFMEHPIKAAEISEQFSSFPDINFIILNHHELPNKKGFPNRPPQTKLTQICSVFNIAQYIASHIDGKDLSNELFTKTLKGMSRDYNFGLFKDTLTKAKQILKL